MALSIEQQRALALAAARKRKKDAASGGSAVPAAATPFNDPGLFMPGSESPNLYTPPSLVDQIMGGLDYADNTGAIVLDRARQGAGNLVGLPVDLINAMPMLANLIPGVSGVGPIAENPVGGSEFFNDLTSGFGLMPDAPKPVDAFQTVAGRVGEEIGANAVPMGGVLTAAGRMGLQTIREGSPLTRLFLEQAAVDPAKFIGKETGAAVAAGAGAGVANTMVDRNTAGGQAADLAGALTLAGITGLGTPILAGAKNLVSAVTGNPRFASNVVRDNVVDTIVQNSDVMSRQVDPTNLTKPLDTQELIDVINRPADAEATIPGFKASTADRAGDTGLGLLEAARGKVQPAAYRARSDANAQAVETKMGALAPTEQPGAFSSAAETERGAQIAGAVANTNDARASFEEAISKLTPGSPNETARGSNIRAALEDAQMAAKNYENQVWERASTGDPVDIVPLADRLDQVSKSLTMVERTRYQPQDVGLVVDAARAGADGEDAVTAALGNPVEMSAYEVTSLRSALTTDIRNALAGVEPDANKARVLQKYVDAIDAYMDETPALAGRFDEARAVSRDINDRFNRAQTGIAQALAKNGGMYQADASTIPGKFVQPDSGRVTDYEALIREAGTDVRAKKAVEDQIIADARAAGVLDDPARLQQFLAERSIMMKDFPDLSANMAKAGRAHGALSEAEAQQTDLIDRLTKPGKSAVAKYLQYGDEKAASAMREVLASKDPAATMDELLAFVNDQPKAVEGARAAFWREMDTKIRSKNAAAETDSGIMPLIARKLSAFLDDPVNAAVAERLYRDNPEHLGTLREIARVLRGVNIGAKVGNAVNPSGTGLMSKGSPPVTLAEAGSKAYQVNIGRGSPVYAITYLAGKLARNVVSSHQGKAYELMLDKILLNPDLAVELLKTNNPANRAALARKAKLWLGNEASTLIDLLDGDDAEDKPDATVDTIMGAE